MSYLSNNIKMFRRRRKRRRKTEARIVMKRMMASGEKMILMINMTNILGNSIHNSDIQILLIEV